MSNTEIVITQGSYKWRAVLVDPTQNLSWLCQEFTNVGLKTEGQFNKYVANTQHVLVTTLKAVLGDE